MRKFGFSAVVTVVLLGAVLSARADSTEAKERAARKACLSGNVQKGVEILSEIFVETEDPTLIYNQGRCFEQNGRHKEAINRFREYLRKAKNISAQTKADTERHIADCRALLGEDAATEMSAKPARAPKPEPVHEGPATSNAENPKVAVAPTPPAPETSLPPRVDLATVADPSLVTPTEPAANPGRGLRIAGITCGAVGVGSIATAIYFYTRARSYSDKVSNQDVPNASDDSAGKTAETMQWVFYGVGGAALATGVVLYTLGWQAGSSHAALAPVFGNGVAGISAQGAF